VRRLDQDDAEYGLRKDRYATDDARWTEQAPARVAGLAHTQAQTEDLKRKPKAEQEGREYTDKRDERLHGYDMREIGARGANDLRVARERADISGDMPVRISTVDENGHAITKIVPRSQALGQDFAAAPTSDQRNRTENAGRANPVVSAISELSERINTGRGVAAKISGAAERAKAEANLSDDVSEYQAVVSGFTPLLARAMGHTGVLTEQDVQSVRKMVPSPDDSKSVRDRKISRIQSLLGSQGAGTKTAPAGETPEQRFKRLGGGG
jgi:hypothetical protein